MKELSSLPPYGVPEEYADMFPSQQQQQQLQPPMPTPPSDQQSCDDILSRSVSSAIGNLDQYDAIGYGQPNGGSSSSQWDSQQQQQPVYTTLNGPMSLQESIYALPQQQSNMG